MNFYIIKTKITKLKKKKKKTTCRLAGVTASSIEAPTAHVLTQINPSFQLLIFNAKKYQPNKKTGATQSSYSNFATFQLRLILVKVKDGGPYAWTRYFERGYFKKYHFLGVGLWYT